MMIGPAQVPSSTSCFASHKFDWGTMFIRRLNDLKITAVLLPASEGRQRLVFPDGKRFQLSALKMVDTSWRVRFQKGTSKARRDKIIKLLCFYPTTPAIYDYLEMFYGLRGAWKCERRSE